MNINCRKYKLARIRNIFTGYLWLACLFFLFSCHSKSTFKYRTYEVLANDDITLTTELGEMIFIPLGALLNDNGEPFTGRLTIKLTEYENLLDSLGRFMDRGMFVHPLQLTSPIIDCTDENGQSLRVNAFEGYEILFIMPLLPSTAKRYEDSLIRRPEHLFSKEFAFDSFRISEDLKQLPPNLSRNDLFSLSIRYPESDTADFRSDARLAYNKMQSIDVLKHYLYSGWGNACGQFIQGAENDDGSVQLRKAQSDRTDSIPFIGFSILELFNRTGKTNLLRIFEKNAKNWEQSLLIVDWTGSMQIHEPEIDSLIEKMELKKIIRHLVLYNDKPDGNGIFNLNGLPDLNSQEGFFFIDSVESFEKVKRLMNESAKDYWGGAHLEESDYSALIRATSKKVPAWRSKYKQIIMLVDNNAPPRDTPLFNEINIDTKIFVIAYDAEKACDVNVHYHNLVRKFGGLLFAEGRTKYYNDRDSINFHDCQSPNREACVMGKK